MNPGILPASPPGSRPGGTRRGFSLIELLIVVAILSALVGVAVPFFQSHILESQRAKARLDLALIRDGILRWEQASRVPLGGGSLEPLLGSSLQEIPRDPWGNEYFFDGNLGVLGSFGADGIQGGQAAEEDLVLQYRAEMAIASAGFTRGSPGLQEVGNRLEVRLTKPCGVVPALAGLVSQELALIEPTPNAYPVALREMGFWYRAELSSPAEGILVFEIPDPADPSVVPIVHPEAVVAFSTPVLSIVEAPAPYEETGVADPSPFMSGPQPPMREDGSWAGAPLSS